MAVSHGGCYEWPLSETVAERFWSKTIVRGDDECWPWTAFRNPSGYGMISNRGFMALAHRVSYALHYGQITDGLHVLHHCDCRECVNPKHLKLGTNADNMRDMVERGRSHYPRPERRGERHPLAILTDQQVIEIRQSLTGAHGEGRRLAKKYGVTPATITLIKQRKQWKHLP